jgi:hypothetical protein
VSEHDKQFKVVFAELKKLTSHPSPPRRQIGFTTEDTMADQLSLNFAGINGRILECFSSN